MSLSDEMREKIAGVNKAFEKTISDLRQELLEHRAEFAHTKSQALKWMNRATCWEKAARNAGNRYDRLKAAVEGLSDRYAQIQAEDRAVAGNTEEFGHVFTEDAEATPQQ